MKNKSYLRVGERHSMNNGETLIITEYFGSKNVNVLFSDGTKVEGVEYCTITRGTVKNPTFKSLYNIGYLGQGIYKASLNLKNTKCYDVFADMFKRAYNEKFKIKRPTYKDVTICKEWHNFQVFAKWFDENYKEGFELDKDILIKGNKVYSPETCEFVPHEINTGFVSTSSKRGELPIGVQKHGKRYKASISLDGIKTHIGCYTTPEDAFKAYKTTKEMDLKRLAYKWKVDISDRLYQTMINYEVLITD